MGIFSSISQAIFGHPVQPQPAAPAQQQPQGGIGAAVAQAATAAGQAATQATQAQPTPALSATDVEATLEARAAAHGQRLNWRTSIVDLMKLLDIDPSLENRKELARELGYAGDTGDSAAMNIWLHKQVMRQLAAHGGRVPAELTD